METLRYPLLSAAGVFSGYPGWLNPHMCSCVDKTCTEPEETTAVLGHSHTALPCLYSSQVNKCRGRSVILFLDLSGLKK